jgi:hypothetical protein
MAVNPKPGFEYGFVSKILIRIHIREPVEDSEVRLEPGTEIISVMAHELRLVKLGIVSRKYSIIRRSSYYTSPHTVN